MVAVEHDRGLTSALGEVLAGHDVKLAWGDAMKLDYRRLLERRPTRVVSNLPYNIATPLVLRLLQEQSEVSELIVMIQREVGERLAATPGSDPYGAVSAKVAYLAEARILFSVSRRVFLPEPDVDSVVVGLRRRARAPVAGQRDRIFGVIEAGFATRRKTIRNALKGAGIAADRVEEALATAGVGGGERAERLGLEEFAAIARVLRVPVRTGAGPVRADEAHGAGEDQPLSRRSGPAAGRHARPRIGDAVRLLGRRDLARSRPTSSRSTSRRPGPRPRTSRTSSFARSGRSSRPPAARAVRRSRSRNRSRPVPGSAVARPTRRPRSSA